MLAALCAFAQDGGVIVNGGLSIAVVQKFVEQGLADLSCRQAQPKQGTLVIKFIVDREGAVRQAAVESTTLNDSPFEACMVNGFARLTFPPPKGGGVVVVSYPLHLAPPQASGAGDASDLQVNGGLTKEVVRPIIEERARDVRACLTGDAGPAGEKLSVRLIVSPTGAVSKATVPNTTRELTRAEECVLSVVAKLKFPAPRGGGVVVVVKTFDAVSAPR